MTTLPTTGAALCKLVPADGPTDPQLYSLEFVRFVAADEIKLSLTQKVLGMLYRALHFRNTLKGDK